MTSQESQNDKCFNTLGDSNFSLMSNTNSYQRLKFSKNEYLSMVTDYATCINHRVTHNNAISTISDYLSPIEALNSTSSTFDLSHDSFPSTLWQQNNQLYEDKQNVTVRIYKYMQLITKCTSILKAK